MFVDELGIVSTIYKKSYSGFYISWYLYLNLVQNELIFRLIAGAP